VFTCVSFCKIAGLGLRFNPSGPFTSTTAFTQSKNSQYP